MADIGNPRGTPGEEAQSLAFSADGHFFAIGLSQQVMIFDIKEGRINQAIGPLTWEDGCCITAVAVNPGATEIAVLGSFAAITCCSTARCLNVIPNSTPKQSDHAMTPVKIFRIADGAGVATYLPRFKRVRYGVESRREFHRFCER